jgi:hypothetical protein
MWPQAWNTGSDQIEPERRDHLATAHDAGGNRHLADVRHHDPWNSPAPKVDA